MQKIRQICIYDLGDEKLQMRENGVFVVFQASLYLEWQKRLVLSQRNMKT